jgi:threonine aldolase
MSGPQSGSRTATSELTADEDAQMRVVDLRSDTMTLPSAEMRRAMHDAELGDDVFGEDPTVNRVEAMAAEMLGKEAALFLLSGTMGNLVGVLAQTRRGDEMILGQHAHIFMNEGGGVVTFGGVQPYPVPERDGILQPDVVEAAIRADNVHYPRTSLVCVENTHNRACGAVWEIDQLRAVADVAHAHGLRMHMDGARVFNAAVALGRPIAEVVAPVDSVTFCFSKGLGCPAGSMLLGTRDYIKEARRYRKMVGGSLRQSGVLAAAGIYALEHMVDRIAEDHASARILAEGLAGLPGLCVDLPAVRTNIVSYDITHPQLDAAAFGRALAEHGVKCGAQGARRVRMVTHYGISDDDVRYAVQAAANVLRA